jgi:hypothetical protein
MSINKTIDQIVEAFIPEMAKISKTNESEEQKERHYKAWLRATLQKFANDVRKSQPLNKKRTSHDNCPGSCPQAAVADQRRFVSGPR